MAAPNSSPTVGGGANIAASARTVSNDQTLFLKVWSGEYLDAYQEQLELGKLVATHTISNAKSYQWPTSGRATAGPKDPGQYTIGDDVVRFGEVEIFVDRPDYAEHFVDNIDELHSHYSIRRPLMLEQSRALARYTESKICGALSQAAQTDVPTGITYSFGGTDYGDATNRVFTLTGITSMAALRASDFTLVANAMADMNSLYYNLGMDPSQAYLVLDPQTYMAFKRSAEGLKLINRDYNAEAGINYRDGVLPTIYEIKVVRSTEWASWTDVAAAATPLNGDAAFHRNTYNPNNTDVAGLFFMGNSVGHLSLLGLQSTMSQEELVDSVLIRNKKCDGVGPLRAETVFSLKLAAA